MSGSRLCSAQRPSVRHGHWHRAWPNYCDGDRIVHGALLPSLDKIDWWWKRTRKLAEIDAKWRLHDLRHWSATHAIAGGHNVRSVAAQLGHSDSTTTMRTYAHALEGLVQGIGDTVAGVLDGEGESNG